MKSNVKLKEIDITIIRTIALMTNKIEDFDLDNILIDANHMEIF